MRDRVILGFGVCAHSHNLCHDISCIYRFSMECLLAYIELTQFQSYIIKQNKDNDKINEDTLKKIKIIEFPSSIPMSKIVEEDTKISKFNTIKNSAYEYKLKAHKLFDKYIKIGSEFEINLSYQQRNSWMGMMSTTSNLWSFMHAKVDLNELLITIEQCKKTMTGLLDHSLTRFKTYDKFQAVEKIFSNTSNPLMNMTPKFLAQKAPSYDNLNDGNNSNNHQHQSTVTQSRLSVLMTKLPTLSLNQKSLSKSTSKSTSALIVDEGNEYNKDTKCISASTQNPNSTKRQQLHILHMKEKTQSASIEIVIDEQKQDENSCPNQNFNTNKLAKNVNKPTIPSIQSCPSIEKSEKSDQEDANDRECNVKLSACSARIECVETELEQEQDQEESMIVNEDICENENPRMISTSPKFVNEPQSIKSTTVPSMVSVHSIPSVVSNDSINMNEIMPRSRDNDNYNNHRDESSDHEQNEHSHQQQENDKYIETFM